ncbi:MAG: hypothetical protein ACYCVL_13210 [Gemmatimonadaceae bacterium]
MRAIPAGRRDHKKFKHAGDMLGWALSRYHYRRRQGFKVSAKDAAAANRFIAMATLTRVAAGHAQAILASSRSSVAESGLVNLRAMLEVWADFRLLSKDSSGKSTNRAYLIGALALLRREPNAKTEADLRKRFGEDFDAAKVQVAKAPFRHWSGAGRKTVVEQQCGPLHGSYYEILSWDVHPVIQVALDIQEVNVPAGKYQLGHREPQHEVAKQTCTLATHILREMWNELAKQYDAVRPATA